MAPLVPTCAPTSFVAGDTVSWTRLLADYPVSEGWVAHLALRGASTLDVTGTTAVDAQSFLITITAGQTGPLAAGQYQWSLWLSLSGAVRTVEQGVLTILPNVVTAGAGDLVSSTETELALCKTQIAELLASSNESYTVGQRAAQKRSLEELTKLRGVLIAKLGRERGQKLPSYAMGFRNAS